MKFVMGNVAGVGAGVGDVATAAVMDVDGVADVVDAEDSMNGVEAEVEETEHGIRAGATEAVVQDQVQAE